MNDANSEGPVRRERFHIHPNMRYLMGGAHRRPAGKVGGPALTRHVTIWRPERNLKQSNQQDHVEWVKKIELYILEIYRLLKKFEPFNCSDDVKTQLSNQLIQDEIRFDQVELLQNIYKFPPSDKPEPIDLGPSSNKRFTRHETVRISGVWQSVPIEIAIELHAEYFTFSSSIDLSKGAAQGIYDANNPVYIGLTRALQRIKDLASSRLDKVASISEDKAKEALRDSYDLVYYRVWEQLRDELYGLALRQATTDPRDMGAVVGDFRGLILHCPSTAPDFLEVISPTAS